MFIPAWAPLGPSQSWWKQPHRNWSWSLISCHTENSSNTSPDILKTLRLRPGDRRLRQRLVSALLYCCSVSHCSDAMIRTLCVLLSQFSQGFRMKFVGIGLFNGLTRRQDIFNSKLTRSSFYVESGRKITRCPSFTTCNINQITSIFVYNQFSFPFTIFNWDS